jgi:hypothetical protein
VVECLKRCRELSRLSLIICREQLKCRSCIADPSRRIDPRRQGEADHFNTVWTLYTRALQERANANRHPSKAVHHFERRPHDHTELIGNGDHVSNATDHCEYGELAKDLASIWVVGKDPLGDLKGEATPRKVREWIVSIGPIRIDKPGRLRRRFRDGVVINDPNKDPRLKCLRDALRIRSAAVNGKQQLNAILYRGVKRTLRDAVPICITVRDEPFSNGADRTKRPNDDRCAGEPVCIKVANNEDRFTIRSSSTKARDQTRRIREELRVVERPIARVKEAANGIWFMHVSLR